MSRIPARVVPLLVVSLLGCDSEPTKPWAWDIAEPETVGMDATTLDGARAYAFQEAKNTQGVVVIRRGVLVAEWYMDGTGPDSYAASWSVAKSFTSALIGIAIERGELPGVDAALADYYPQWQRTDHAAITIEHILRMTSGLTWDERYDVASARDSDVAQLVLTTGSPLAYVLDRPVESAPNTEFHYSSGDTLLLSGLLAQATGMPAGDYAEQRLLSKLGIERAEWWAAKTGETLTYCCLDMTSRDFARFGLLYMNGGRWDGEQIVPAAWVDASLAPSPRYEGYGYKWWLLGRVDDRLPDDLFAALGHDGQYIYVIPSLELVVVRNGSYYKDPGPAIADPTLFIRYPSGGIIPGGGTTPPDSWDDPAFLGPIIDSIVD